ncbi:hypothetical protein [Catenulispora pinisilvae]|uniref:hypothetical protein n=1 Tax=Catenulispora pinisilvae TaxID=2705253 RepID=UPI0018923A10|nr:hypothetical protein [Catenulispora pinisilvae]
MELNPDVQRRISESLMADRWQAREMARPGHPSSKWILVGPQMRGRLVMINDLFGTGAHLASSTAPYSGRIVPNWQVRARFASAEMILAMARVAETASDDEPVAWSRRRLHRRLRDVGWKRVTSCLRVLFGTTTQWTTPDGTYRLTVSVQSGYRARSAVLTGPDARVSIAPTTPVAVVVSLAEAVASGQWDNGKDVA